MDLANLREECLRRGLSETDLHVDPFQQFRIWYDLVGGLPVMRPDAMILATATPNGTPSARTVLLKGFDERGFVFFSNYESRKGRELASNPQAALLFFWVELDRQVRIEGTVQAVGPVESDEYFRTRPRDSQLSTWASRQGQVVAGRVDLDRRMDEFRERYAQGEVPRPPYWGGYRVVPHTIEFWQGRPNRLHDRLCYFLEAGAWKVRRLAP
jgi:pyridoxamine 5'-phosphate oxidase